MKTETRSIAGIPVVVTISKRGEVLSRRTRYAKPPPKPKRYVIYPKDL